MNPRRARAPIQESTLAGAGVATFVVNLNTHTWQTSTNFLELMALPSSSSLGAHGTHLLRAFPDARDAIRTAVAQASPENPGYLGHYGIQLADGSVRNIMEKGVVAYDAARAANFISGIVADTTGLRMVAPQDDAIEQRFARAIRGTQDGLWEVDLATDTRWFESRFEELLGYGKDELSLFRERFHELVHPQDLAHRKQRTDDHLLRDTPYDIEFRMRHKQGHYEWVRSRGKAERDETGKAIRFAGSMQIVTDRKMAERAALDARLAAEAANRAKSEFLANMSHEIRTPLNGIIGMTKVLTETQLDEDQHEYVNMIRGSGQVLLSLINDILDLSRIDADRLELEDVEFDLRELIHETASVAALQGAVKGIELIVQVEADVPAIVRGDPGRLRQIVMNLCGNAVKFTPRGHVTVTVSVENSEDDRRTLRIDVGDTGIGIPADRLDRLFKPFSQVDASTTRHYGGSGLGLSIVKRLAEMMGGVVSVISKPDVGSVFTVTLCVRSVAERPAVPNMGAGRKALLVDDNPVSRQVLQTSLQLFGFEVMPAATAEEALQILGRGAGTDIVVADEWMPNLGGMDLLRMLRADIRFVDLPFILLSVIGADSRKADWLCHPDAIVFKPMRSRSLADTLNKVLRGQTKDLVNAPRPSVDKGISFPDARVLLVEDNVVNQRVAQHLLGRLAVQVVLANNGAEALERMSETTFDAILMDCQMPVMDGFTATRRIRDAERQAGGVRVPIIALTANVMIEDQARCIAAGMDAHLAKPIEPARLIECLALLLRKRPANPAVQLGALPSIAN